jgi:hypothetical protein
MVSRDAAGDDEDKPLRLEIIPPSKPPAVAESERPKVGVGAGKDGGEDEPSGEGTSGDSES